VDARDVESRSVRRLFLARFGVEAGILGASLIGSPEARAANASWRPARHPRTIGFTRFRACIASYLTHRRLTRCSRHFATPGIIIWRTKMRTKRG
jgi:hypothetical protein